MGGGGGGGGCIIERLDFRKFLKILKSATETPYKILTNGKSTAGSGIKVT